MVVLMALDDYMVVDVSPWAGAKLHLSLGAASGVTECGRRVRSGCWWVVRPGRESRLNTVNCEQCLRRFRREHPELADDAG